MSFTGGGSDLPAFYRQHGGAVLSTAIDRYVYVTLNPKFDNGIRVAYSKNEEVASVDAIEHKVVKATLKYLDIVGGIEITTIADIPSRGTGLGSSSSFTVGLLHALNAFKGRYVTAERLGSDACHIEMDLCGEPIGKQDQYAAAFGGFNLIEFNPDESVLMTPIICPRETIKSIEQDTLLLYTGITRSASQLLKQQSDEVAGSGAKQRMIRRMMELTYLLRDELQKNNTTTFGDILHENWMLKREITQGISNGNIDEWYERARTAGALGGKILGAGAGGFLMLYAPQASHASIVAALPELRPVKVGFEPLGSRIIFYH
ncbi:MAG: GHMP family kinase ATP-binding protein [Leptospirales bacterium]